MTIVVESGAGLSNAECYASVAEATAFHAGRGNGDAWDAVDDKEAALRKATDYLTQRYRGQWAGLRRLSTQALDWPRVNVPWRDNLWGWRPIDVVPAELKYASAELALKSTSADLLADLGRKTLSETVDVISVTYADGGSRQTEYATVHGWLKSLLAYGDSHVELSRA
jgi:hypothetical protein